MTESGPTQPADDRETRKLIASLPALRMSPDGQRLAVSTPHVSGTWFVVECFPDDRSDFGYVDSVKVADWVAVAKSAVGEITEAHTRNAVLRAGYDRQIRELHADLNVRQRALYDALGPVSGHLDRDATRYYHAIERVHELRRERDRLRDEVVAALAELNDPARLSGGNTPAAAAAFLARLARMDDVDHWLAQEDRRTITLSEIIARAAELISSPGWGSAVATPADTAGLHFKIGDLVRWSGDLRWFEGRINGVTAPEHKLAGDEQWSVEVTELGTLYAGQDALLGITVHVSETRLSPAGAAVPAPADAEGTARKELSRVYEVIGERTLVDMDEPGSCSDKACPRPAGPHGVCLGHSCGDTLSGFDVVCRYRSDHGGRWHDSGSTCWPVAPAPSVGADPEDEVLAELREDERQHAELNPKLAAPPAAVADTAHERTKPDA